MSDSETYRQAGVNEISDRIVEIRRSLSRVQGTTGPVITEPKLDAILDVLELLAAEIRELQKPTRL